MRAHGLPFHLARPRHHRQTLGWRALRRCVLLLLAIACVLPPVHAAHHPGANSSCTLCHFAHGGVPALLLAPAQTTPARDSVTPVAAADWVFVEHAYARAGFIRGPPSSPLS